MEKEVTIDQPAHERELRDVETNMDPESGHIPDVDIAKIESVYRKLDLRIIPGKIRAVRHLLGDTEGGQLSGCFTSSAQQSAPTSAYLKR